ncbi:DUF2272 domain-containing protein [Pararoseomonas indoligenes]|uniref:DUF2272 domain-containing protein n=1 Tax=Roseomonas indoligenes TaxID=2820811 RepID=A0A940N2R9_9PROT|nr:DUF2272 domain-containing protein [Pararoseomonas indoligenes]MBP0494120.1 DUF2272 domain-containing protein [Pararoseomonas indoligenes]
MKRFLGGLLALLAVSGCAVTPPPPVREAPIAYPPSVRARLLRIVEAEWVEWGRITVGTGLPRPPAGTEGATDSFPRVLAYWRAVPDAEAAAAIARNRARWTAQLAGRPAEGVWSEPAWSAAFVSWLMRAAGVDEREFHASASHAFYLDAILRDAAEFPAQAPFVPHDVAERAPEPGDLICADRSRRPLSGWRDRLPEAGQFRPMHCDVVIRTGPGVAEAVGGNIADAVTLTLYETGADGLLGPRRPGQPVVFAVIENRLGRLPPFQAGPVISSLLGNDRGRD